MHLSERTTKVLKNFSGINPSIVFKEGNFLTTMAPAKTIIGKAEIDESFEKRFAIYDLSRFLGVLGLFEKPELVPGDKSVVVKEGNQKISYVYSGEGMIVDAPAKDLSINSPDVQFDLSSKDFQAIMKAASTLGLPELVVTGDGTKVSLTALDSKAKDKDGKPVSDTYSIDHVGDTDKTFNIFFKADNLRLIPDDYNVKITLKGISQFTSKDGKLKYWVTLENNSKAS